MLPALSVALETIQGGDAMKQQGDLFCHPKADGCPLLSRVSLLRATQMSSSASVFAADPPCVIQAVYSLKGFSLSRHLAPSHHPSASPAPHPGTQPLQLWKWKTPCCWDTQGRKGARFTESTALALPLTPFSCLPGLFSLKRHVFALAMFCTKTKYFKFNFQLWVQSHLCFFRFGGL